MQRSNNIHIWNNTVFQCTDGLYKNYIPLPSYKYQISDLDIEFQQYEENRIYEPDVQVHNMDTIEAMGHLRDEGFRPLVLNMANDLHPGGGVRHGAKAQEEDIFRISNAFMSLHEILYPMEDNEVIYSPAIYQIKDSHYNYLTHPRKFSMISVAALRQPNLYNVHGKSFYEPEDELTMRNKINMIFYLGVKHNHDSLVLGALGCGAFHNPPREVASFFKDAIRDYGQYFKGIVFAVKSDNISDHNYNIFREIIKSDI